MNEQTHGAGLAIVGEPETARLEALERVLREAPEIAPVASFAPLHERAAVLTSDAMNKVFDAAAYNVEQAAEELMQLAVTKMAEAKGIAEELRRIGAEQAEACRRAADLANEVVAKFREQRQQLTKFRNTGEAA